jgi:diadenosine tetraphosphatase ApaH/serine/threonine PP2A family protein phosphatase
MFHKSWASQPRKPTILHIEDSWQRNEKYISIEEIDICGPESNPQPNQGTMPNLPIFQRRGLLLISLLVLGAWAAYTRYYRPHMEHLALTQSAMDGPVGEYAAHSQPEFTDMVLVQTLDQSLVPTSGKRKDRNGKLVIVGDVHGMKNELVKLLDKVQFNKATDHLILAGDMISKGPDSTGVLDLVMELGATAVRGNHEDRILLAYAGLHSKDVQLDFDPFSEDSSVRDEKLADSEMYSHKGEFKDRLLAKQLSHKHIAWLKKCPVILRVGEIEGMGQVLVVHAGLVPGINLHAQDPYFVMNMRTIDLKTHIPSDSREGTKWTKVSKSRHPIDKKYLTYPLKLWNYYQGRLEPRQRSTVIYGHDSKRGLSIDTYTKGLDTGCLKGGQLTALVIEGGLSGAKQTIVQVNCADGRA